MSRSVGCLRDAGITIGGRGSEFYRTIAESLFFLGDRTRPGRGSGSAQGAPPGSRAQRALSLS